VSWTDKLLEYAPDIAGAIMSGGTTLPALAIKAFKDATGEDVTTEAEVKVVVDKLTPEMKLKLASANNAFKIEMAKLSNELTNSELSDKQDARKQHKHSKMPAVINVALTLMVAACGVMIFQHSIPTENAELAYLLFGALVAKWGDSIAYWVGTTRSSADKSMQASLNKK